MNRPGPTWTDRFFELTKWEAEITRLTQEAYEHNAIGKACITIDMENDIVTLVDRDTLATMVRDKIDPTFPNLVCEEDHIPIVPFNRKGHGILYLRYGFKDELPAVNAPAAAC